VRSAAAALGRLRVGIDSLGVVFVVTVAAGVAAIAAISLSPLYVGRLRLARSVPIGGVLVVGAIGLAAAASVTGRTIPRDEVFLAVFVSLLVGSLLILGDDGDDPEEDDGADPPWWPEFEADFGRYARRRTPTVPGRSRR
jgi:hypothetical protein